MSLVPDIEALTEIDLNNLLKVRLVLPYLKEGFEKTDLIKFFLYLAIQSNLTKNSRLRVDQQTSNGDLEGGDSPLSDKFWLALKNNPQYSPLFKRYTYRVLRNSYCRVMKKGRIKDLLTKFRWLKAAKCQSLGKEWFPMELSIDLTDDIKTADSSTINMPFLQSNLGMQLSYFNSVCKNSKIEGVSFPNELSNIFDDTNQDEGIYNILIKAYSNKKKSDPNKRSLLQEVSLEVYLDLVDIKKGKQFPFCKMDEKIKFVKSNAKVYNMRKDTKAAGKWRMRRRLIKSANQRKDCLNIK